MSHAVLLASDDASRRPTAPRRGLSCAEAADYIGVSVSKFLEMVDDGRMPSAKAIDRRRVWDLRALDRAFDELGEMPGKSSGIALEDTGQRKKEIIV